MKKKLLLMTPVLIGIAMIVLFVGLRTSGVLEKGEKKIITSSTLMDTIDIAELSAAEFTYNGIARIYKDEEHKKVKCYIRYNAKVKAGIDMKEIDIKVDKENKKVTMDLPKIEIKSNSVQEESLEFIPENTTVELKDVLSACKEDSESEAKEASALIKTAKENLHSIIEALLYPVLEPEGYEIVWK